MEAQKPLLVCCQLQNRCNSTFSISDSLTLVQLKYSLNNFCPQPETNDALTGLATSISKHKK